MLKSDLIAILVSKRQLTQKQAESTVERIAVYVGRTGALTPVAHVRPVTVGRVMVQVV